MLENSLVAKKKSKPIKSVIENGADHTAHMKRLGRVQGQVSGIQKMVLERRYCPEILQQLKAARSALHSIECLILEEHLRHCVQSAMGNKNTTAAQVKIEEIINLLKRQS